MIFMIKKDKKIELGFTLVEMLVSLFIIALLSGLVFANYRAGQKDRAVIVQAETMVNDIRSVQNKAINGVATDSQVPYGYGIYVRPSSSNVYKIFADNNNDQSYQPSEAIETITLQQGVTIASSSSDPLTVLFQPPFAIMYINGVASSVAGSASVTLQNSNGSLQKTIVINNLGNGIYVQ